MSVRQALLALLEQGPMYGYQLRAEFEQRTGATWPLNVGQVYTTLTRLERDGLVEARRAADGEGHVDLPRSPTPGRDEVATWFTTPVAAHPAAARRAGDQARARGHRARGRRRHGRPAAAHRDDAALQDYTRLKRAAAADPTSPTTWPGSWCSTRWSSPPRPRSAGSTTARPGCAAAAAERPTRAARRDATPTTDDDEEARR